MRTHVADVSIWAWDLALEMAGCPWLSHLPSLGLGFPACKMVGVAVAGKIEVFRKLVL